MPCSCPAQTSPFEGKPIVDIRYSPESGLNASDLARAQPLVTGAPLRSDDVSKAIDGLYATGQYADIAVEAEASGNGVIVTFVTQPRWFVGSVNIEGKVTEPPNAGELHSNTQLSLGAAFADADLTRATESIKRLFTSNGLYEATVTPTVDRRNEGQQVFITFTIDQGKRAKYQQPVITADPPGQTLLSNDAILRVTGWRIPLIHFWRQVTSSRTQQGAQALLAKYQKQERLTAQVNLTQLDYDADVRRVTPHLNVKPGPKVEVKAVEAKVSKKVMRRYVPVFQERAVDNDLLVEGRRNLMDYFASQGYYNVDIDFRVRPVTNDLETVEYVIAQGQRQKLAHVTIAGNRYFDEATIRERMFITPASFQLRHGRYSEAFRRKDEENIAELYKSNGFRDVKVSTTVENNYKGKPGQIAVTVTINEGEQWLVAHLTLTGMAALNPESVMPQLASIEGQPFAEVNLANDRNVVLTRYFENGYPAATFKASWQESETPHRVNVRYEVTEGRRQYVRDVLTSGNHYTRQALIAKTITLKTGDPLSPVAQSAIQRQFYDLGIFARADTAIQNADGETDYKYILYNFQEANRYRLNVGLGAQIARFGAPSSDSLSNPGGSTGFSPSISVEVSRLNFLGRGHTVSLRTVYSSLVKRASITYQQPRFRDNAGRTISYTLLYDDSRDVRTFSSRREEASVQLSQQFSRSLNGLFRFSYRRVSVSNVIIPVLLVPELLQPVRLGILSGNLAQDRRNNPGNPSRGIYNTIDIGLADKIFGSQRNFLRVLGRNATYYGLGRNIVLARQTQVGIIFPFAVPAGFSVREAVPLPERFFGGGADSLRAFPFNQAGPRDTGAALTSGGKSSQPTGFPLGGNALFVNNVELRFPFIGENIQGVLFHDMGNVFSSLGNFSFRFHQKNLTDFDYAVHAVGFGIRYRTPVGPIRVDLAYSVNPPAYNGFSGTAAQLLQCNPNANPATLPSYCTPQRLSISHLQFFFSIGQTF
ncbi:MAG: outer membrane protein insertion porin family [Bryobacterales bacterium]|jgi:outer membrane protein assembly complex protein YaeT|nr:outer membrane protein insertion porin family [Bryobacterales bacterium]